MLFSGDAESVGAKCASPVGGVLILRCGIYKFVGCGAMGLCKSVSSTHCAFTSLSLIKKFSFSISF